MIFKEMMWIYSLFQTFALNFQTCQLSLYLHAILGFTVVSVLYTGAEDLGLVGHTS